MSYIDMTVGLKKTWIDRVLEKWFKKATLSTHISKEMQEAQVEIMQAEHVILMHRFQKHMAESKIHALIAWSKVYEAEHEGGTQKAD